MSFNTTIMAINHVSALIFPVAIAVSFAVSLLMVSGAKIFFKGLQQRGYHARGYINWINKSNERFVYRLANVSIFSAVAYATFSVVFAPFAGEVFSVFGLVFFYVFQAVYFKTGLLVKNKERQFVDYTARLKRLQVTFGILVFALSLVAILLSNSFAVESSSKIAVHCRYIAVCVFPLLIPALVLIANWVNTPMEKINIARYGKKARHILEKNNVKVIAVTGSFGKTTTKDIIASLLREKYNVASAPKSFNTPSGLSLTVQNFVTEQTEYAVLEMGARKVGDIAYLCKIAKPDIAVITSVGKQHIESFKSLKNIKKTKFEIVQNMKENGVCFFNCNDEGGNELYQKAQTAKFSVGENGCDLQFEILKVDKNGSKFSVLLGGETHEFTTTLLGRHNVENVCLGIAVAYKLGVEIGILQSAVAKLEGTEHRLQMIKKEHAVIIDDSYNSNVKGMKYAAEVLASFEGRKILITPGLVELGKIEDEANREMGRVYGKICDKIILVGGARAAFIAEGLKEVGFDTDNLITFDNFGDVQSSLSAFMKAGDVVLFENDVPDSYL